MLLSVCEDTPAVAREFVTLCVTARSAPLIAAAPNCVLLLVPLRSVLLLEGLPAAMGFWEELSFPGVGVVLAVADESGVPGCAVASVVPGGLFCSVVVWLELLMLAELLAGALVSAGLAWSADSGLVEPDSAVVTP